MEAQVGAAPQEPAPLELAEASPASDVDSPLTVGTVLGVALISIAVVLFAKVLAGTPRRVEEG